MYGSYGNDKIKRGNSIVGGNLKFIMKRRSSRKECREIFFN